MFSGDDPPVSTVIALRMHCIAGAIFTVFYFNSVLLGSSIVIRTRAWHDRSNTDRLGIEHNKISVVICLKWWYRYVIIIIIIIIVRWIEIPSNPVSRSRSVPRGARHTLRPKFSRNSDLLQNSSREYRWFCAESFPENLNNYIVKSEPPYLNIQFISNQQNSCFSPVNFSSRRSIYSLDFSWFLLHSIGSTSSIVISLRIARIACSLTLQWFEGVKCQIDYLQWMLSSPNMIMWICNVKYPPTGASWFVSKVLNIMSPPARQAFRSPRTEKLSAASVTLCRSVYHMDVMYSRRNFVFIRAHALTFTRNARFSTPNIASRCKNTRCDGTELACSAHRK